MNQNNLGAKRYPMFADLPKSKVSTDKDIESLIDRTNKMVLPKPSYKIFADYNGTWRQYIAGGVNGEFDDFESACKEADRISAIDPFLIDHVVSTGFYDEELYRAREKK